MGGSGGDAECFFGSGGVVGAVVVDRSRSGEGGAGVSSSGIASGVGRKAAAAAGSGGRRADRPTNPGGSVGRRDSPQRNGDRRSRNGASDSTKSGSC